MSDGNVTNEMCNERSGNIKASVDHLHTKFDKLDKDLRNGISAAIQANSKMLERHDAYIRWMVIVGSVLGTSMLTAMGWAIIVITRI